MDCGGGEVAGGEETGEGMGEGGGEGSVTGDEEGAGGGDAREKGEMSMALRKALLAVA